MNGPPCNPEEQPNSNQLSPAYSMILSPAQAAEAVGMTRQGILKAIRSGRISASKSDTGEWQIVPSELFRVYPAGSKFHATVAPEVTSGTQAIAAELQAQLDGMKTLVDQLRSERDDLRRRLDQESDERRALQVRLLAPPPPAIPEPRRAWWKRLAG